MKIAYLFSYDISKEDGVIKKIKQQVKYWQNAGHEVQLFVFSSQHNPNFNAHVYRKNTIVNWISDTFKFFQELKKYKPDVVYLRQEPYKPYFEYLFKNFPVVLEVNSFDTAQYRLVAYRITDRLKYIYHKLTQKMVYRRCKALVCVTYEIAKILRKKIPSCLFVVVPNSINLEDYPIVKKNHNNIRPKLVLLSSPNQPWQGVDKIIWLAKQTINQFDYLLIGIEKECQDYNLPKNIKLFNYLERSDYLPMLEKCSIGIGTLALHRKMMQEACSLKVREYLAYGLPVIIGYQDTAFMDCGIPEWVLQLPNTEDNVTNNLDLIINFINDMHELIIPHSITSKYIDGSEFEKTRLNLFEKLI